MRGIPMHRETGEQTRQWVNFTDYTSSNALAGTPRGDTCYVRSFQALSYRTRAKKGGGRM